MDIYEKFHLNQYTEKELKEIKEKNITVYKKIKYREQLIKRGEYEAYHTEIFRRNILKVIDSKIYTYGDKLDNINIRRIRQQLRKLSYEELDAIAPFIRNFIETYSEEMQEELDYSQLEELSKVVSEQYNTKTDRKIVKNKFKIIK